MHIPSHSPRRRLYEPEARAGCLLGLEFHEFLFLDITATTACSRGVTPGRASTPVLQHVSFDQSELSSHQEEHPMTTRLKGDSINVKGIIFDRPAKG